MCVCIRESGCPVEEEEGDDGGGGGVGGTGTELVMKLLSTV